MSGLELAALKLATVIVRSACMFWVGDREAAAEASSSIVDLLQGGLSSRLEERKTARLFEECADIVAGRVIKLVDREFARLPENERNAAIIAVHDTFATANLTDETLYQADLDPHILERNLHPSAVKVLHSALLSEGGEQFFFFLLRESCAYLVEVIATLPRFRKGSVAELLGRQTVLLQRLELVLNRLPDRRDVEDFTTDYRRHVALILDRMELFGARLHEASRNYPLSIAYLSLCASFMSRRSTHYSEYAKLTARTSSPEGQRVDRVIAGAYRTLLVGEAGSGKTTLLRWLAVRAARADLPGTLGEWNEVIPFYIPLRRYVGKALPRPEQFLDAVGRIIAEEMPPGWVQDSMRSGKALVLIDGVDELPGRERGNVRQWLFELLDAFPNVRFVVTSRPEAISDDWLDHLYFRTAELQPMSPADVREFVSHWHDAVKESVLNPLERGELTSYEEAMIAALRGDRHLRRLAVSPLLCALLCALNRELRTKLPRSRMEIYDAALTMLVEQRDRERGVETVDVILTRTEKFLILENLALWLVRNGRSYVSEEDAVVQVDRALRGLRRDDDRPDATAVFRYLLERSGVLREPVVGGMDFVHRTFQEYMAGKAAVDANAIGEIVRNADDDQWREVVIMAAGHAQPRQCAELLEGLLERAEDDQGLRLLALACLQTGQQIEPDLRRRAEQSARGLMPPKSLAVAEGLAAGGDFVLDLLPQPTDSEEAAAIVHTAMLIGGDDAFQLIERIANIRQWRDEIRDILIRGLEYFDPEQYARAVLAKLDLSSTVLPVGRSYIYPVVTYIPQLFGISLPVENWFTAGELSRLSCAPDLKEVVFSAFPRSLILSKPTVWQLFSFFDYDEAIADVRRRKENAIDEQDFELAAALRDDEKHLLTVRSFVTILEEVLPAKFPNLVSLTIDGFGDSDLIRIPPLSKLESLTLIAWPTISRLQGINKCPSLKHLELRECGPRESFSLDSLSEAVELKSIRLDLGQSCILDLAPLAPLSSLSDLYVDLCGDIDLTRYAEQRRRHGGALTLHVAPGQIVHGSIPASNITIRRDERRHSD